MDRKTRKEMWVHKAREAVKQGHTFNEDQWNIIFVLFAYALCDYEPPDWIKQITSPDKLKEACTAKEDPQNDYTV